MRDHTDCSQFYPTKCSFPKKSLYTSIPQIFPQKWDPCTQPSRSEAHVNTQLQRSRFGSIALSSFDVKIPFDRACWHDHVNRPSAALDSVNCFLLVVTLSTFKHSPEHRGGGGVTIGKPERQVRKAYHTDSKEQ